MATHHTLALQSSTVGHLTVTTRSCLLVTLHEGRRLETDSNDRALQGDQIKTKCDLPHNSVPVLGGNNRVAAVNVATGKQKNKKVFGSLRGVDAVTGVI